jgi:hypothetical protein
MSLENNRRFRTNKQKKDLGCFGYGCGADVSSLQETRGTYVICE